MQAGRHLVHRSVAARYAELLAERANKLHVGNPHAGPAHLGPIINGKQADRIESIVDQAVRGGAKVLAGARREGPYYWPTVLTDVTPAMPPSTWPSCFTPRRNGTPCRSPLSV